MSTSDENKTTLLDKLAIPKWSDWDWQKADRQDPTI